MPPLVHHRSVVFGCAVEMVTAAPSGTSAMPLPAVIERLHGLDAQFSRFRPDSELSRLNASAGTWFESSAAMYAMLRLALEVAVASRGLVNAAVLPWLRAAGYVHSWPDPEPLEAVARPTAAVAPLTEVLEVQPCRARLQPGAALDLGGLAKGRWADDVVRWLGGDASCSLGGDVACAGPGPGGTGWPVRLADGRLVAVRDGGVATSGVGKRRWGAGAHHIIDPRTGRCADSDVSQVAVLAPTATEAEWAATAIVVGGTAEAARLRRAGTVLECHVDT